jgi:hypothetical protein
MCIVGMLDCANQSVLELTVEYTVAYEGLIVPTRLTRADVIILVPGASWSSWRIYTSMPTCSSTSKLSCHRVQVRLYSESTRPTGTEFRR